MCKLKSVLLPEALVVGAGVFVTLGLVDYVYARQLTEGGQEAGGNGAGSAVAYFSAIYAGHWQHRKRRRSKEDFVCRINIVGLNGLFTEGDSQLISQLDDDVAGDAPKDGGVGRGFDRAA